MAQSIEQLRKRLEELERLVSDPDVLNGDPSLPSYLKQYGALREIVSQHDRLLALREEIESTRSLIDEETDPEMLDLAGKELEDLLLRERRLRRDLLTRLSVDDADIARDVIMEIRPGVGGDEAALFAADLLRMYQRYAESQGWKTELLDADPTDLGGFKLAVLRISGRSVYPKLRFEGGTHRVQRVPETESQGRIHTSTATVAVLPEAEEVDVEIAPEDLEITVMHSRGPGGQSVNTASSAVRILHKPSGIMVRCDVERSQRQNKAMALRILRSRLLEAERAEARRREQSARRSQIGTGDRSERIRTYNFPQNRVTDHRLEGDEKNFSLERVIRGDLDPIIERLGERLAGNVLEAL